MASTIRPRSGGRAFQLRIKHRLLHRAVYVTFDTEKDARAYSERVERSLAKGVVPDELVPERDARMRTVGQAIDRYVETQNVRPSAERLLVTLRREVGSTPLASISYAWAEEWVRQQKVRLHRCPGTVRKHKGALSRVLNWLVNRHPQVLADNPLVRLERGFSSYTPDVIRELDARGVEPKRDTVRDRRLDADEERRILEVIAHRIGGSDDVAERQRLGELRLLFSVALETAMRLREMYTLAWRQVDIARRTFFLERTKNGDSREVPMSSVAVGLLSDWRSTHEPLEQTDLLFPQLFDGDFAESSLERTTSTLSHAFGAIFDEAGVRGLVFRDTRHEGVCRLVLRTSLSAHEISRITGHKDPRMLRRYMSLRGSELATRLW